MLGKSALLTGFCAMAQYRSGSSVDSLQVDFLLGVGLRWSCLQGGVTGKKHGGLETLDQIPGQLMFIHRGSQWRFLVLFLFLFFFTYSWIARGGKDLY